MIRCIAISSNGGTILTGGQDQLVKLWNAASGKVIRAPLYHGDLVRSVAIDPRDTLILSGCRDGIARIWGQSPPTIVPTHHLELWAQKLTGIAIDDSENVRPLSLQEWQQLRVRLNELGIDKPE